MLSDTAGVRGKAHCWAAIQDGVRQVIGRIVTVSMGQNVGATGIVICAWVDSTRSDSSVMLQIMSSTSGLIDVRLAHVSLPTSPSLITCIAEAKISLVCENIGAEISNGSGRRCKITGISCIDNEVMAVGLQESWPDSINEGDWETVTLMPDNLRCFHPLEGNGKKYTT